MKLLKNKEVRGALLWQLSVAVIACSLCFWFDLRAGLTAVVLSLLLMLVFCISTYKRYQRISSLADDIDQVLHGDSSIDFDNYSEGELSILHSEIYKMTVRLREQQQKLINDKKYLADSLNSVYTRSGQNSTPNSNATNLHSSQKRCCSFCISSSNASPTFQVQKSIFHQMTKPIQVTVILPLLLAISFSRNDDIHSSISGISNDLIGVIPTIGQ